MNDCFMVKETPMQGGGNRLSQSLLHRSRVHTVIVAYIAVQTNLLFVNYASRFVSTYREFSGGTKHRLIVCCNGGALVPRMRAIFDGVPCEFFTRPNDGGWDISAYQDLAHSRPCDLLVCFGESVRFHRPGWLDRLVDSANEYGEGMYGCLSSYAIRPHLNTTAFAVSPRFLKQYPLVSNKDGRYEFEHGTGAMWRRIRAAGGAARLVTWDGCWGEGEWRKPKNILWRGDQSNCLVFCNHTDNFVGRHEPTRNNWAALADGLVNTKQL
jgi:hypothetical protein